MKKNILAISDQQKSVGDRWADKVAKFGGSWTFIIFFKVMLIAWIVLNSWVMLQQPFDPYPYIFLNLVLSCIAALQAPIIMMSQNRQEAKDRIRAEKDYRINLKAEREIQELKDLLKELLSVQQEKFQELEGAIEKLKSVL
ncbi:MAG: DUF1003 domain-containing protein [Proteobacteria bacterium]|nr:DUF1003 domain-containing protein [Pseudomonadota bacterium]